MFKFDADRGQKEKFREVKVVCCEKGKKSLLTDTNYYQPTEGALHSNKATNGQVALI